MAKADGDGGVQSIRRALDIVEALGAEADGVSITKLCRVTGLRKSTAHRILATLKERRYVIQEEFGRYRLSFRICSLSRLFVSGFSVVRLAIPDLKRLCSRTCETVHMVMREDDSGFYLRREEFRNNEPVRVVWNTGMSRPLHVTAAGKSILAAMDDAEIEAYWGRIDKTPLTKNTIRDLAGLMREIGKTRKRGYALDFEENTPGVNCLAMSLPFVLSGKSDLAVSVTGPKERMTASHMKSLRPLLEETRDRIVSALGVGAES